MKKFYGVALFLAWLPAAQADLESVRAAAHAGNVEAQLELGELYEFGFGLKENAVPALAWYLAASRGGNARASQRASVLTPKLTAAQRQEAERMSLEFKTAARAPVASPTPPAPPKPAPKSEPAPAAASAPSATPTTPSPAPKPASPESASPAATESAVPANTPSPSPAPKPAEDDRLGPN